MPVLIGYVAAIGKLDSRAWQLYAVLFLGQLPHFMATAWMYREDYARTGYRPEVVVDAIHKVFEEAQK